MSATRPAVHACRSCRQVFASRRSLRRHDALDHRPAPDGELLTSLLAGHPTPPRTAGGRPHTTDALPRRPGQVVPESPDPPAHLVPEAAHTTHGAPMVWIALLVLLALVAGVLGTLLEMALWAVGLTVLVLLVGGAVLARAARRPRVDRR